MTDIVIARANRARKEIKMPRVIISGRETGRGAFTSAGGRRVNISRSGNHWDEIVEGPIGHEFVTIDITNSGKHWCFKARITGDDEYEKIEEADPYECQFCSGGR